ncbi:MAG: ABC transporter permease [Phycisphaerae bacterium]
MSIWRLVIKEIVHRKLNFALALVAVLVAVACAVGALTLLRAHDLGTEEILADKTRKARAELDIFEDEIRKLTVQMGYNTLILPAGQNIGDYLAQGYATATMPEEYVKRLSGSKIVMIQHLMPILEQKVKWPERQRTIILCGTRGEMPLMQRDPKKPIVAAVAPGKIVLGYSLWSDMDLKAGDKITLMGRPFEVARCHEERFSTDDITAWVDLAAAQELLDKKGQINAIQALKCMCAGVGIKAVVAEITKLLPDVQIKELANKATAREKARDLAAARSRDAIAAEAAARERLRQTREVLAACLVPLVMVGCAVWIGLLSLGNVHQRREEIGILRAIGVRSRQVMALFLAKAMLVGLVGAVLGYAAGFGVAGGWARMFDSPGGAGLRLGQLMMPWLLAAVLVASPLLACFASWAPATLAARSDPADVLGKE